MKTKYYRESVVFKINGAILSDDLKYLRYALAYSVITI